MSDNDVTNTLAAKIGGKLAPEVSTGMEATTPETQDTVVEASVKDAPGYYSDFSGVIMVGRTATRYPWPMGAPFDIKQVAEKHVEEVEAKLADMAERGFATLVE